MPIRNGCDGKVNFKNEIAVKYHLSENKLEGIEDYYICKFCKGFHVFTMEGKKNLSTKIMVRNYALKNPFEPRKMKMKKNPTRGKKKFRK